jgi:hypothetical protein
VGDRDGRDDTGRGIRLLEVDAAAAARHDRDVAAGLTELDRERQEQIRAVASGTSDVEAAAWLISVIAGGIAMKQAAGQSQPDADRLRTTLLAAFSGLS